MIVGVVSDTHGWFHPELPSALGDCDLILHAGDVGDPSILERLAEVAPTRAVPGNIDGQYILRRYPAHDRFEFEGLRFWMTHIAGHPDRWQAGLGPMLRQDPPDVFICGHSHILRIERVASLGNMLFLNPGAAGRQGFHQVKTCVRLHLDGGKAVQAEVVHLDESPA
ncbi:MAG: metallophosphoesterase family protein [Rhodothermales bacterium]|nr:metallophosphoesterase family protein [Rhodothermales bacterium]MBO6779573.1 metallophosphoesterase family protein [Rhodothermales bacterium]